MKLMSRIEEDLEEVGQVESQPKFEGRQVVMVLTPSKKKAKKAPSTEAKSVAE
jgi:translation initiation factor IF-3